MPLPTRFPRVPCTLNTCTLATDPLTSASICNICCSNLQERSCHRQDRCPCASCGGVHRAPLRCGMSGGTPHTATSNGHGGLDAGALFWEACKVQLNVFIHVTNITQHPIHTKRNTLQYSWESSWQAIIFKFLPLLICGEGLVTGRAWEECVEGGIGVVCIDVSL